jgi:hypothetical protein
VFKLIFGKYTLINILDNSKEFVITNSGLLIAAGNKKGKMAKKKLPAKG